VLETAPTAFFLKTTLNGSQHLKFKLNEYKHPAEILFDRDGTEGKL